MSLPLEKWCVSLDADGRMKRIDAELKERLAPFAPTKSARFRFAYELAFALVCWDRTDATLQSVLRAFQVASGMNLYAKFPAQLSLETGKKGAVVEKGNTAPLKFSRINRLVADAVVVEMAAWKSSSLRGTHALRRVAA